MSNLADLRQRLDPQAMPRYLRAFAEESGLPLGTLRRHVRQRRENGLAEVGAVVRLGRGVNAAYGLIPSRYFAWLHQNAALRDVAEDRA